MSSNAFSAVSFRKLLESDTCGETTFCQRMAALTLGHWQALAPWPTGYPPSLLLVNAGEHFDPCLHMARIGFRGDLPAAAGPDEEFAPGLTVEGAIVIMRTLVKEAEAPNQPTLGPRTQASREAALSSQWAKCQHVRFGSHRTLRYDNHDPGVGLPTNYDRRTTLFVETPQEISALERDIKIPRSFFWKAWGADTDFKRRTYLTAILGSISPEAWTPSLVDAIVDTGAPILVLPHRPEGASQVLPDSEVATFFLEVGDQKPWADCGLVAPTTHQLPPGADELHRLIYDRLHGLPPGYVSHVQSMVHHLGARVRCLVSQLVLPVDLATQIEWAQKMQFLAFDAVLRGILFGLEFMSFHCRTLGLPDEQAKIARRFMAYVRQKDTQSLAGLAKRFSDVPVDTRGKILDRLVQRGLLDVTKDHLRATSAAEFIKGIPFHPDIPQRLKWSDIEVSGHEQLAEDIRKSQARKRAKKSKPAATKPPYQKHH